MLDSFNSMSYATAVWLILIETTPQIGFEAIMCRMWYNVQNTVSDA